MLVLIPISVLSISASMAGLMAWHFQGSVVLWSLAGAGLGLLAVVPFRSYRISSVDPGLLATLCGEPILETRTLDVPGHRNAYNPSLISFGDGHLLSFRVKYHSVDSYLRKVLNVRTSYIGIARMGADFTFRGRPQLLDLCSYEDWPSHSAQDGRLIRFEDRILLFFNDYAVDGGRASCAIYVTALVEDDGVFRAQGRARMLVAPGMAAIEKNWIPFVAGGELYLVYSGVPHRILRPDLETGLCEEVSSVENAAPWAWGEIRGGTPAVPVDGRYLTFFHSSLVLPAQTIFGRKTGRSYAMGAYVFDGTRPFAVASISPPLGRPDFYRANRRKVVFPSGMVVAGDRIHVVWGKNDAAICLSTFDGKRLLELMRPVPAAPTSVPSPEPGAAWPALGSGASG